MPTERDVAALDFESRSADDLIKHAWEMWGADLRVACGFTLEDLVILHKLHGLGARPDVFFVDTGRHPEHTFLAADAVRAAFSLRVRFVFPDPSELAALAARDGVSQMSRSPEIRRRCCQVRRHAPLDRALAGAPAWMMGARRSHCGARSSLKKLELDREHEWVPRLAPLADWEWADVVGYINEHRVPANTLFRRGFAALGCAPCTRAIETGQPERSGRWPSEPEDARERGRHMSGSW